MPVTADRVTSAAAPNRLGRGFVLLAPVADRPEPFDHMVGDPWLHQHLLADAQRLRGRIALEEGAIRADALAADGRHIQAADDLSWHLLTVDQESRVTACIRYLAHAPGVRYTELGIARSFSHQPDLEARVERSVRAELNKAACLGFSYVELGGWVVSEELRCSTEAFRMLLMMYSLSQHLGGAVALSTATTRHNSSSILRRTGGKSLVDRGSEIVPYYDPNYNSEMELLSFDSRFPNPRYVGWVREFRDALLHTPIISSYELATVSSLHRLNASLLASQPALAVA